MNELTEFTGTKASKIAREIEETEAEAIEALAELEEIRKDDRMRDRDAEREYALAQYGVYDNYPEGERMRRRANDMVRYGIYVVGDRALEGTWTEWHDQDELDKAIDIKLEVVKRLTPEQITAFDATVKEIDERNIRAKDERRRWHNEDYS